jgi:phosphatidylglycerol:prolipoprotein diacylglycerol transferase
LITISVDPIAFLNVRWYGVMVALAVAVVVLWVILEVRRGAKISYEAILTASLIAIPSGVIISRLLHVIDRWDYYSLYPGQIVGGSGLTIYGAVLGATLGIWVYSRFSKINFGYLADLLAPAAILAQAVGRVGCTINGCCYGVPTSLPWGVVYTNPESYAPLGVAVHPVPFYEIIYLLIIFGVVFKLRGRLKPDGSLFLVYLSLYSLWRIGIDFLREGTPFLLGLHQAQVIGIIVLAIAVPVLVLKTRWVKTKTS